MLREYKAKRDFTKTPEPKPERRKGKQRGPLTFVVQKHAARRLHYDLRLELDGVLVSWAVPKGPSLNPADKRLAVRVEDHTLGYATFEGSIPAGEYGGGEVIVWDQGTYSPDEDGLQFDDRQEAEKQMREGLREGKLSVTFRGSKMKGSWALVRTKDEKNWLLLKHRDEHASDTIDLTADDHSVRSGLTVEDVRKGKRSVSTSPSELGGAVKGPLPKAVVPMSPVEVSRPSSGKDWSYEVKLDGIRAIAIVTDGKVRLHSRKGIEMAEKFAAISRELAESTPQSFVLDGEIVVYDENGVPSFHAVMERFQASGAAIQKWEQAAPAEYCVFDLLYLDGYDLKAVPFGERRQLLERNFTGSPSVRLLDVFPDEGNLVFEHALKIGFEGVVGKRLSSRYQEGAKTPNWIKVKGYQTEDFAIVGWTEGEGSRKKGFGSLVLAKPDNGGFTYVGNVGTGFVDPQIEEITRLLRPLERPDTPLSSKAVIKGRVHWVEPIHWAEVRYMKKTNDDKLRIPVFERLRPDKAEPTPKQALHTAASSDEVESVLEQLEGSKDELKLQVGGHEIKLTSLSKELWPAVGKRKAVTKRDLIRYYAEVSKHLVPHLADRPLTLVRFPNGIDGERFFQKHYEHKVPEFVKTVDIWSESNKKPGEYLLCNNLPTLLWLGQIATLEIHPWYSRVDPELDAVQHGTDFWSSEDTLDESVLNYPDFMVFDLDPYIYSGKEKKGDEPELNRKAFKATVKVAKELKEMTDSLNLRVYLKTSGKTGLHVYIPIVRDVSFDTVRALAETFGRQLERAHPKEVTLEWSVAKRPGKVFFDYNQNVRGKTLVSIYSPRPQAGAPVSFPADWDELDDVYPPQYDMASVPKLLSKRSDAWADILDNKQDLAKLISG